MNEPIPGLTVTELHCPPCTQNCDQGDRCPAYEDDALAPFVGVRNCVALLLAAVMLGFLLSAVFG